VPGRVRTRRQFDQFRNPTTRAHSGPLKVAFVSGSEPEVAVAFSIGRRVANAVVRNRLRRQLRAIFDNLAPQYGKYLVRVYFENTPPTFDELQSHLTRALQRSGLLGREGDRPSHP